MQELEASESREEDLSLWALQRNPAARWFYERHGFVKQRQTGGCGNAERDPDLLYEWVRRG
jgi:putative acetyltransferase